MPEPMSEFEYSAELAAQRLAPVEAALRVGGALHYIAEGMIEEGELTDPTDVCDVLMPRPDGVTARWQLIESRTERDQKRDERAAEKADQILALTDHLGNRLETSLPTEVIEAIQPDAIVVVEGGANRTAVVRGALAEEAMQKAGVPANVPLYFLASDRPIPVVHPDGRDNVERTVAQSIAPDTLREGDVTEYLVTEAVFEQLGYERIEGDENPAVGMLARYVKGGHRPRTLLKVPSRDGVIHGLNTLNAELGLDGRQIVVASNGQYREKLRLQVVTASELAGIAVGSTVVLGDEAGYQVNHLGEELTTAARGAVSYMNELVTAYRQWQTLQSTE